MRGEQWSTLENTTLTHFRKPFPEYSRKVYLPLRLQQASGESGPTHSATPIISRCKYQYSFKGDASIMLLNHNDLLYMT